MKKIIKIVVIVGTAVSLLFVLKYFKDANASDIMDYETESPFYTSIVKEVIATGKLNPEDEIELKPQVSGIIDKILV
jgi:HlyD family secretion protein